MSSIIHSKMGVSSGAAWLSLVQFAIELQKKAGGELKIEECGESSEYYELTSMKARWISAL